MAVNMNHLGATIKKHRKIAGLSQSELAMMAGVGKTLVFDLEHGKLSVRFDKLLAVLDVLNIKMELNSMMDSIS